MKQSFRNAFTPDWKAFNIKKLRLQLTILLIGTFVLMCFFVYTAVSRYYNDQGAIIIQARVIQFENRGTRLNTYKSFDYGHYSYVTGTEGKLYYHPQSMSQALLFHNLGGKTIIDYLLYFLLGVFLFLLLRKTTDQKSFSKTLIISFGWVAALLFYILPMLKFFFQELVTSPLLLRATQGKFEMADSGLDIAFVPLIIFMMLLYFLKKGFDLQEELELTV